MSGRLVVPPGGESNGWQVSDHTYRYLLGRRWGKGPRVLWVMLNPSTADDRKPDKTLTRCVHFSMRWEFGSHEVVNLYAFRTKDPAVLAQSFDPIGNDNDRHITEAANRASQIVVAWGGSLPRGWTGRPDKVLARLRRQKAEIVCLGKTLANQPKHPLYLAKDTLRRPYH